jgi:polygalacturonase
VILRKKPGAAIAMLTVVLGAWHASHAQDTRKVTEPRFPAVCKSLSAELAAPNGVVAEADEQRLDTARLQAAIDSCKPGSAVELRTNGAKNAFLSGPIELKAGITLLVSEGATLYASRDPRVYDTTPGTCGVVNESGKGCKPLISIKGAQHTAVMGDGVIDGRGYAKLLGKDVTWWELAEQARKGGHQNCPRIIVAERADDFTLYRITLRNSPNFHVVVGNTNGFTAWGVKLFAPQRGARNTDGIDPISSFNISILNSYIHTGDDNVALKAGKSGPVSHVTVANSHFYAGHGMSIGSETDGGVSDIDVHDLTIDGADNGLRIKSNSTRGGLVERVTYRGICIRNVKNPIVIDPFYSAERGEKVPTFRDVTLRGVRIFTPGRITLKGADSRHYSQVTFDGVLMDGQRQRVDASFLRLKTGPGAVNIVPTGEDVVVENLKGEAQEFNCESVFVPYPELSAISQQSIEEHP